jgi:uncharacterized protein (DUF1800 family)
MTTDAAAKTLSKLVARAAIRAGREDDARLASEGWQGWVDDQLSKPAEDSTAVRDFLSSSTLKIGYEAGDGFAALPEEKRPFTTLHKPVRDIWYLADWDKKMAWEERIRPGQELVTATVVRAALSDAQLRETVTDFWRDHFSINRYAVEDVQVALPTYDQDVLHKHALGNFREMLEAVSTSTAMLAYLNNASSKASPANENFARELMELHTLGAPAYLHDKFDKWREVPGALDGLAEGYIDEDVYEAARAFTGWSYEGGQWISEGFNLPKTGEFKYIEAWHDPYQKRVLGVEFESHLGPMVDGKKVLDLVAFHQATARFVCWRLCQRFVSDQPPQELVDSAAALFVEHAREQDQLKTVIRHVLLSDAFKSAPDRLQRPLFLMGAIQRSSGVTLKPDIELVWQLDQMGQKVYAWHSPAGHPQVSGYWQSPGLLVRRWRGINSVWQYIMDAAPERNWPSADAMIEHWSTSLGIGSQHAIQAKNILRESFGEDPREMRFHPDDRWGMAQALTFLSSTPDYQAV